MSSRHLTLERISPAGEERDAGHGSGDRTRTFCHLGVRRDQDGDLIGAAVAYDLDVDDETVWMAVCLRPGLAGSEAEAEAAGLFLNYLFELHRFREVHVDGGHVTSRVTQLIRDLKRDSADDSEGEASDPEETLELSAADWRANRRVVEVLCGLPPRRDVEVCCHPAYEESEDEAPGRR